MSLFALMVLKVSDSGAARERALRICNSPGSGSPSVVELLASALDVSHVSWIYAGSARQLLVFACRTLAERTPPGTRQSVCQQGYWLHAYHEFASNLIGVVATDANYPKAAAFRIVNNMLCEFRQAFPSSATAKAQLGVSIPANWPFLNEALSRYKDPVEADQLQKIQQDLDETRHVVHQTIHNLLERGEKLDSLVEKSADLSSASRAFYRTAKNQNSCCSLG